MKRDISREEVSQLVIYLRKCVCNGLTDRADREDLQQEMWLFLLESGFLEDYINESVCLWPDKAVIFPPPLIFFHA